MTLRLKLIGSLSAAMVVCGASQVCAATYNVADGVGSLSVNGTITTDGNIGVLSASDIQSWSLTISGFSSPVLLNNSNSDLNFGGNGLTATSVGLFFDYSGSSSALDFAVPSSSFVQWGDAGALGSNAGLNISSGNNSGSVGTFADGTSHRSGTGQIAEIAEVTPTPLPATLPLFAIGLGALSWLGWHKKRKSLSMAA